MDDFEVPFYSHDQIVARLQWFYNLMRSYENNVQNPDSLHLMGDLIEKYSNAFDGIFYDEETL